jgi:dolichol kinase
MHRGSILTGTMPDIYYAAAAVTVCALASTIFVVLLPFYKILELFKLRSAQRVTHHDDSATHISILDQRMDEKAPLTPSPDTAIRPTVDSDHVLSTCLTGWALVAVANSGAFISCFVLLVKFPMGVWPLQFAVLWKVPLYLVCKAILRCLQFAFKSLLFKRVFGMSDEDFDITNQDRMEWTGEEIAMLENKYGERQVKIADSTVRRVSHVVFNSLRALFYLSVGGVEHHGVASFQTALLLWAFNNAWHMFIERSSTTAASFTFCATRIRDGRLGRLNVVSVQVWEYSGMLITFCILTLAEPDPSRRGIFFAVAMQPVVWGDAFAEIVGSFFGRCHFPVLGIGEVNQKSVEGCIAALLSNLIALLIVLWWSATKVSWKVPAWQVALAVAFVGMVAETIAVRSTDNAVMMLSSLVVILMLRSDTPHQRVVWNLW